MRDACMLSNVRLRLLLEKMFQEHGKFLLVRSGATDSSAVFDTASGVLQDIAESHLGHLRYDVCRTDDILPEYTLANMILEKQGVNWLVELKTGALPVSAQLNRSAGLQEISQAPGKHVKATDHATPTPPRKALGFDALKYQADLVRHLRIFSNPPVEWSCPGPSR